MKKRNVSFEIDKKTRLFRNKDNKEAQKDNEFLLKKFMNTSNERINENQTHNQKENKKFISKYKNPQEKETDILFDNKSKDKKKQFKNQNLIQQEYNLKIPEIIIDLICQLNPKKAKLLLAKEKNLFFTNLFIYIILLATIYSIFFYLQFNFVNSFGIEIKLNKGINTIYPVFGNKTSIFFMKSPMLIIHNKNNTSSNTIVLPLTIFGIKKDLTKTGIVAKEYNQKKIKVYRLDFKKLQKFLLFVALIFLFLLITPIISIIHLTTFGVYSFFVFLISKTRKKPSLKLKDCYRLTSYSFSWYFLFLFITHIARFILIDPIVITLHITTYIVPIIYLTKAISDINKEEV